MTNTTVFDSTDLDARIRRLEDESAIQRPVMSYGPAADAGRSSFAAALWLHDGEYDRDANGEPRRGSEAIDSMLQTDAHRQLMAEGVAHFGGPLLIDVDDDRATAVNYSLIMRRDEQRFYLWPVSAVRWDLDRCGSTWRVRRRTNRLLDETGAGRELFGTALHQLFPGGLR